MTPEVAAYAAGLPPEWRAICDALAAEIDAALPDARARIYHRAPVWFLAGNPIVGYWLRKSHVQLLFWSGQSFATPGLSPEGKFKAAEARVTGPFDRDLLRAWLEEARAIQWDYQNIVKRRGVLERL